MSMYSHLLGAALDIVRPPGDEDPTGAALARLLRCRADMSEDRTTGRDGDGTYAALVDNLNYDLALIELARHLGVECDASEFDQPDRARARLEGILSARAIRLDGIGE